MTAGRMHRRSMLAGLAAAPLALSLAAARAAQPGIRPGARRNAITITATDLRYTMPARVAAGLVTMTLENAGRSAHAAQIVRHEPDVLLADIQAALEHEGIGALAPLVTLAGGPGHLAPDGRQTVIQELSPGAHAVICTATDDHGIPHALTVPPHPFEVVADDQSGEAPAAETEVRLVDFAFEGLPAEIPAGRQVWKVTSAGTAPHELGFRRLDDGVTAELLADVVQGGGKGLGDTSSTAGALRMLAGLPISPAGGIQALAPGLSGWVEVDLAPGSYVAISVVPNLAAGLLDAQLGMMQGFRVTES